MVKEKQTVDYNSRDPAEEACNYQSTKSMNTTTNILEFYQRNIVQQQKGVRIKYIDLGHQ